MEYLSVYGEVKDTHVYVIGSNVKLRLNKRYISRKGYILLGKKAGRYEILAFVQG